MKSLLFTLLLLPFTLFANDKKIPSKINEVNVYLNGAQINRSAKFNLDPGTSELKFIGLSPKVDENSIQISGLQSVSILSMDFGINYLNKSENSPEVELLQDQLKQYQNKIALLKNKITGLQEEEMLIITNRNIKATTEALDLEKLKQISSFYRKRITEIRNEILTLNTEINTINKDVRDVRLQLNEVTKEPAVAQGELIVKFDAPITIALNLSISYLVADAGWVPTYDIKSDALNNPINLKYKAHVYQNTGAAWKNVKINLSTGNPNLSTAKPNLDTKYLNYTTANSYRPQAKSKSKYYFNPTIKKVTGIVTDQSGQPLPGVSVLIKGTNKGTQTDFDGNYSIEILTGQELTFSYIGQKSVELPIYASLMNIHLEEDSTALEEVVVSGYGAKSNVSRALAGKVSGVQIRGNSSIKENLPLYVIDGVPMSNFIEGDIDANEIQSMEVLKGESTAAIYGSRGTSGVILITTKKSHTSDDVTNTKFEIKKPYSIASDGDVIAIEINTFILDAKYEYLAIPVLNENVFLTASFTNWEKYNLLPGEANIYFKGGFSGKTVLDPYTTKKEMTVSLGIDAGIIVSRKQDRNFKSKSFMGNNRILDRAYDIEIKNNKAIAINLKLMDRIPMSQNKEIKIDEIKTYNANYNKEKGILTWKVNLKSKDTHKERFLYQVKYPKHKHISL
mgnify:CR=1 FL=1